MMVWGGNDNEESGIWQWVEKNKWAKRSSNDSLMH